VKAHIADPCGLDRVLEPLVLGSIEGALYLTAAMTGLRQGELIGLLWRDVDWLAGKVRVRRAYVRGEYGTAGPRRALGATAPAPSQRRSPSTDPESRDTGPSRPMNGGE